jgi:LysM repeat protein
MLLITLDEDGQVSTLQANLLDIQTDPVGSYGIISAGEAFQRFMDPNRTNGIIESMHSATVPIRQWRRTYPMDQTLTIYGNVFSVQSIQPDKPPFIQIDGFPVVGQVAGLDRFSRLTYVQATGRFVMENGIEKFSVDSWKVSPVNEDGLIGTLQRENDQTILTAADSTRYALPAVPDDVPMPFENAYVIGTKTGDVFQWKLIDNRMAAGGGGGGGGGGGSGFYKLNMTGTPVPFPSPTQASGVTVEPGAGGSQYVVQAGDTLGSIAQAHGTTIDALMHANGITDPSTRSIGQTLAMPSASTRPVEALRGMLTITISKQQDGSQLVAYGLLPNATSDPSGYMLLEGNGLDALQAYNNRPVDIWGTLDSSPDNGIPSVKVARFEIPFPDLKFQILQGKQKLSEISRTAATLFTAADGKTYVQLLSDGTTGSSLIGVEGDQVQIEALAIPGEALGGYPALRVFAGSLAIDPKTGQPMALALTANKPSVVEVPAINKTPTVPTAIIEKVELVHFTSDPRYAVPLPDAQPPYFQPVWSFYGHYSNGDEFDVLIQALRDEYLQPEIDPYLPGG